MVDNSSLLQLEGIAASPRFPTYTDAERDTAWMLFEQSVKAGQLATVPMVAEELHRHSPPSHVKLMAIPKFVVPRFSGLVATVAEIIGQFPDLVDEDLEYEPADPWLVAFAVRRRFTVVTNEFPTSFRRKPGAPRIPDVCQAFELECIDMDEMLSRLGLPSAMRRH